MLILIFYNAKRRITKIKQRKAMGKSKRRKERNKEKRERKKTNRSRRHWELQGRCKCAL